MRLLTRSDFDGLGCAALLKDAEVIDEIRFVHPKDVQDGKIEVTGNDVLANIPFVPGCGLWFDHHSSEEERNSISDFKGVSKPDAPSAARVIYEYYGGDAKFVNDRLKDLVTAVDKADSGDFTADEILDPRGWALLSFVMDPRTGLGRYKDYRISNYQLMEELIDHCRQKSIDDILAIADVKERVDRYKEQNALFRQMLMDNAAVTRNLVVVDLRDVEEIYTGNRFLVYSLFPDQNISLQVMWGFQRQNIVITAGHSILNRTCRTDVGSLMLEYGGGGHRRAGTCQIAVEKADEVLAEMVERITK